MKKTLTVLLFGLIVLGTTIPLFAQKLYTAFNVWYEKPSRVTCINYQRGTMIPAGTAISDVVINKNTLSFKVAETGVKISIAFNPKYHSQDITVETLKERLVTTKTFDQLTAELKPYEKEAIRQGIVIKGMSRKAVLTAFGYPPEHKTPSLDDDKWMFWKNRFVIVTVPFDANGMVSQDIK